MSPEYSTWHAMKRRCFSPQVANYAYYGGRGIGVCERWKESFGAFLADMGPRPSPDHTLDRIDPDADYCPENCRWATRSEQQRNKRNNRLVTLDGESITLAEACERLNLPYKTIQHRLQLGWSEHRALHEPLRRRRAA